MDWMKKTGVKRLLKLLLIAIIFCICYFFIESGQIDLNKGDMVLGTIITSLGIIIAIVTTFIFSKIFSERNERIERKKLIDLYSRKLTSLRRLSHKIQTHTETLWLNTNPSEITRLYPDLTLWTYRDGSYEKFKEISEKTNLGEGIIQAYLAARLLEGSRPLEYMLNPTYHKNYSLDEISTYREASIFIYSFLSDHQGDIRLDHLHEYWATGLEEEVQKINSSKEKLTIKSLYLVFNDAYTDYLVRLYQLTQG